MEFSVGWIDIFFSVETQNPEVNRIFYSTGKRLERKDQRHCLSQSSQRKAGRTYGYNREETQLCPYSIPLRGRSKLCRRRLQQQLRQLLNCLVIQVVTMICMIFNFKTFRWDSDCHSGGKTPMRGKFKARFLLKLFCQYQLQARYFLG